MKILYSIIQCQVSFCLYAVFPLPDCNMRWLHYHHDFIQQFMWVCFDSLRWSLKFWGRTALYFIRLNIIAPLLRTTDFYLLLLFKLCFQSETLMTVDPEEWKDLYSVSLLSYTRYICWFADTHIAVTIWHNTFTNNI